MCKSQLEELHQYDVEPIRIDSCKIVEVIKIEYIQGSGTKEDPIHLVNEYRTLEGKLIAKIIV